MIDERRPDVVEGGKPSLRRRWTLPLGVAAAVTATGVAAVLTFGGGAAKHAASPGYGPQSGSDATPTATWNISNPTLRDLLAKHPDMKIIGQGAVCDDPRTAPVDPGYAFGGTASVNGEPYTCFELPTTDATPGVEPTAPVITAGTQTPIPAEQVSKILKSCAGDAASGLTPLIAVHTAVPTKNQSGYVIAEDGQGRFVECSALDEVGRSNTTPPYWSGTPTAGHPGNAFLQPFDGGTDSLTANGKNTLVFSSGHYSSDVKKITVTYGDETTEYPAIMNHGVFYLSVSTPSNPDYSHPVVGYIHAYDANNKEVYNSKTDAAR